MKIWLQSVLFFVGIQLNAQLEQIPVLNPSFEGMAAAGTYEDHFNLGAWFDIAPYYFRGQTPPDIQSGNMEFFDVTTKPLDGNTYLGMVTRQNETWELVSQRLGIPLKTGNCYAFDIHLARSDSYFSRLLSQGDTTKKMNFNRPIVLRIWGGRNVYEKRELLAESDVISHADWRAYHFEFNVKQDHNYLILEAFYKTPTLLPYNGNILLDNASDITQIYCPGEEIIASVDKEASEARQNLKPGKTTNTQKKPETTVIKKGSGKQMIIEKKAEEKVTYVPKILKDLDTKMLKEGQIIKIEQLYFEADSSNFTSNSFQVLDEIYNFLVHYPNISIEIGGHTNGIPGVQYCQTLSLKRARAVASYLYQKGIPESRIIYKGYGKTRPIASNRTHIGRQKNQRVEIKILKVG